MTINEAQDLRKKGFIMVLNSTSKKVLICTKNEDEAYKLKAKYLLKNRVVKIFFPLVRVYDTKKEKIEDVRKALNDLKLGLNVR